MIRDRDGATADKTSARRVSDDTDVTAAPHLTGCPCGCEAQPQLADDPDCIRHEPSMGERYKRRMADRTGWKPARSRPWAFIEVDEAHELAIIRGKEGIRDALDFLGITYGWSRGGRGWVFDARYVPDVEAYANWRHMFVVVSKRKAVAS
jgi:hypothetical protein